MPPQLKKDFLKLVEKYLNGSASPEEIEAVENYYAAFSDDPDVTDSLNEDEISELKGSLRQKIDYRIDRTARVLPIYRQRYFQVAATIVLVSLLSLFAANKLRHKPTEFVAQNRDLAPGGNKATLTLADGSKIDLNSIKNGVSTAQPGARFVKESGQLAYNSADNNAQAVAESYNTLTTPKGGQYQLTLADGTRVWLNAASSLKYPTAFAGSERIVELTGEAYFEVAHNAKQPFKVRTANQEIQDIGTQFDVNSYADETDSRTTLVEGSVKVINAKGETMMKPGQQYLLKTDGLSELKDNVDTDEVTAWKNGMFQFNNADIRTIMRQVARWYDIDVEFKGEVPNYTYHGKISRNSNASQVLKILELSGVNFTIEGRKIIVK